MILYTEGKKGINSLALRIFAVCAMICDCIWTYLIPGQNWVMQLNWFAFPIFAFLLAEGFNKTSDRKLFAVRLAIFAVISEIPYNLMVARAISFPRNQNIMFTLYFGFLCMSLVRAVREKWDNVILTGGTAVFSCWAAGWLGSSMGFDMGRMGPAIIMVFYIASGVRYTKLMQFVSLALIAVSAASDFIMSPVIGGYMYKMPAQAFSLLALLAIWCYNGDRGPNSLALRRVFYAGYPIMCLAIALLS